MSVLFWALANAAQPRRSQIPTSRQPRRKVRGRFRVITAAHRNILCIRRPLVVRPRPRLRQGRNRSALGRKLLRVRWFLVVRPKPRKRSRMAGSAVPGRKLLRVGWTWTTVVQGRRRTHRLGGLAGPRWGPGLLAIQLVTYDPEASRRTRAHEQVVAQILNSLLLQGILIQTAPGVWKVVPK